MNTAKIASSLLAKAFKKPCASQFQNLDPRKISSVHLRKISTAGFQCKSLPASNLASDYPSIQSVIPQAHQSCKVVFDNEKSADFKYIWLRDNCGCNECVHRDTKQKLVDSPSLDVNICPKTSTITPDGKLVITWPGAEVDHVAEYSSQWLYKYGQCFMHETYDSLHKDLETHHLRPNMVLWDRETIWKTFPELAYEEFISGPEGVRRWLELIYTYGIAVMRRVPPVKDTVIDVVKRFAYVKETQYGVTFDVISEPDPEAHLAFSGKYLDHHTDMNYREKSPGLQMLHCLKANKPTDKHDPGGKSFFVDGFSIAKWLEENEPSAFHILTATPVRFQIKNQGKRYSHLWPIICLDRSDDIIEIHYNNRTMAPIQIPTHVVTPFYHAYQLFTKKVRDASNELVFNMVPGDLVAFNNRRILHGRTAFDPTKVSRHLQGCYSDIDEVFSKLDSLNLKSQ